MKLNLSRDDLEFLVDRFKSERDALKEKNKELEKRVAKLEKDMARLKSEHEKEMEQLHEATSRTLMLFGIRS